jgi:PKD repeat protein
MISIITGLRPLRNLKVWATIACLASVASACDKMPLLAPQESTITLSSNSTIVQANGTAEIRATVLEKGGIAVQNGTTVTFTTNLGALSPNEARTVNGVAMVQFVANGQSGTAQIGAISGGAKAENITLAVGSAAAGRVVVTASPSQIPAGGSSVITATLTDTNGNPLNGVQVAFSSDAGTLSNTLVATNFAGQAQVTLTTSRDATVTANSGGTGAAGPSGSVKVTVTSTPDLTITSSTTNATEGQAVNFNVTVSGTGSESFQSIVVDFGDGTTSGILSGTSQSVSHVYESSGTFTVAATGTTPSGNTQRATSVITVAEREVVNVTITRSPTDTINTNEVVTFTASTNATNVRSYSWNFGDGQTFSGSSQVSHTYTTTGRKTVTLTVTTTDGNRGVGQIQFVVEP